MKTLLLSIILLFTLNVKAQTTYVPDDNFEQWLIDNGYDNVLDNYVSYNAIYGINFLSMPLQGISDLTGIEDFTALSSLSCIGNQLTSLDVSQNTALTYLNCGSNDLTSLDVSQNTALISLACYANDLTSLDVSQNTALTHLSCGSNDLTSLDVSQNTALTELYCANNDLTSLNVYQNIALTKLGCQYNLLTYLNVNQNTALTSLSCHNNQLVFLNVSLDTALTELYCANNQLNCLNVKNGNNTNLLMFSAVGNPSLYCIEVDDVAWSDAVWSSNSQIDTQVYFSNFCGNSCTTSTEELNNTPKQLSRITDLMGRETPLKPNMVLIYVYDDGSTERVFKMEDE